MRAMIKHVKIEAAGDLPHSLMSRQGNLDAAAGNTT